MKIKMVLLLTLISQFVHAQDKMAVSEAKTIPVATAEKKPMAGIQKLAGETRETKQTFPLPMGEVRLTVNDWDGEPVARDVFIKVELKCSGETSFKLAAPAFNTCKFTGLEFDPAQSMLTIRYHPPAVIKGEFGCDSKASSREFKIGCKN